MRYFEEFIIGERYTTHGRTVTETDVVNYAGITGDFHPIHTDETYAKTTPYGRRLPHGQLILSLALGLAERSIIAQFQDSILAFYGLDRLRFIRPVFIGDTIRLERAVAASRVRDVATGLLTFDDQVLNQEATVVLRYSPIYLVRRRPA